MKAPLALKERDGITQFEVRVSPNASRCKLLRELGGGLKLRVDAPPVDGAANARIVRFFAKEVFGVSKRSVRIVRGDRGRNKLIAVELPESQVRRLLTEILVG